MVFEWVIWSKSKNCDSYQEILAQLWKLIKHIIFQNTDKYFLEYEIVHQVKKNVEMQKMMKREPINISTALCIFKED